MAIARFASRLLAPVLGLGMSFAGVLGACVPPDGDDGDDPPPAGRTTFAFEPIAVDGIAPRWGSPVAPGFVIGGVNAGMIVQPELFALASDAEGVHASALAPMAVPRYCGCALFDAGRRELVVFGGRDGAFVDAKSAEILNVDTGALTDLDDAGAADHPVGCQAFFSSSTDKGYIFGGLDSSSGFTGVTYRYDPAARSIVALDIAGPAARYDAGVHELANGDAILVGGMGGGGFGATFFSDVWRFNAQSEQWSTITTISSDVPAGRRYPWSAVSPDESVLLFGFGSDSPRGESVLGDLWRFDLNAGTWSTLDVDGALPAARGFTFNWQGPADSAGVLAFGSNADLAVFEDAFVMRVPDELAGTWR